MNGKRLLLFLLVAGLTLTVAILWARPAQACGGLFCQNSPVDQNAERIIFTDNGDGTVTAIIQIQYTGFAPDFSWILPMPSAISAEDLAVPETGMQAFLELEQLTNVQIIPPPVPETCSSIEFEMMALAEPAEEAGVEVFASGEVGPFGFDVVGSEDPTAMIMWLRDNEYLVTEEMEPLIQVYVEEEFVFLAMKLLPDQGVQDIQPIQVTYESEKPMIPLRLTAVAANPDMAVLTWFFANEQAVPVNYAHMEIPDEDLRFFWPFGGNNYRQLIGQKANQFNGKAFLTEYAGPSNNFGFSDPLLNDLTARHPYLTRLNTVISPEEMTLDPIFEYDGSRTDVSNVRDLSNVKEDLYECERVDPLQETVNSLAESVLGEGQSNEFDERSRLSRLLGPVALLGGSGLICLVGLVLVVVGVVLIRRRQP
jgi:hypothetical protein